MLVSVKGFHNNIAAYMLLFPSVEHVELERKLLMLVLSSYTVEHISIAYNL